MCKPSQFLFSQSAKFLTNKLLGIMGVKLVSSSWGPRGFLNSLSRVKKQGVIPHQIIDIGAARGEWTTECMPLFPDADYLLIEPLNENFICLDKLQKSHSNLKVWMGAAGAKADRLKMHVHSDQSSFFESEYSSKKPDDTELVNIRMLDSFLDNGSIKQPNLIKADVQGFEIEALKGADKCLEKTELLLLEVSYQQVYQNAPLAHDVISYVGSKGFRIFDICSYIKRPLDNELAHSDILFAKKDSVLFKHKGYGFKRQKG